ncbi:MAG: hypothetical protein CMO75_04495, partial [Verrucomicrobiales bacterium]|nr:hypothetical protein [Verrucomicrobiales bacterium]
VKQHLAAGKDVNAPDRSGFTPLHVAANYGQKEIVELLIAKSTLTLKGSLSSANHWHFLATDLGKA